MSDDMSCPARMPTRLRLVLLACLAAACAAHAGEQRSGDFVIRYNALTTAALPATAASTYDLPRSNAQGLLIIAVERNDGANVPATVRGHAQTLLGRAVPLQFRRIDENGTSSTLGTFSLGGNDTVRFDLDVTPQGGATTHVQFVRDFVVD